MDFGLNEEQKMLKESVSEFMKKECSREYIRECDEKEIYPEELLSKMGKLGWFGICAPASYGGSEMGTIDLAVFLEELSRNMFAAAHIYFSLYLVGLHYVLNFGNEEQKSNYIPRLVRNEMRFSFALTEPDAGSDAASLTTSAKADGDYFLINGQKTFITGAKKSDVILVTARTDESLPKNKGISMFLVDSNTGGIEMEQLKKLGMKAMDLWHIFFEDARVHKESMLGKLNEGWTNILKVLDHERFCVSVIDMGAAQSVVDDALQYAKMRKQFGQPIGKFQMIKEKLADMQVEVDAARLLCYRVGWMLDNGVPCNRESSIAKLYASECYMRAAWKGLQIMGGYGYMMDYDIQRHFRDAKVTEIGGGTSEIQRLIIAKAMGLP